MAAPAVTAAAGEPVLSSTDLAAAATALASGFDRCAADDRVSEHRIRVADSSIAVRLTAGWRTPTALDAMDHLLDHRTAPPDLVIRAFDGPEVVTPAPAPGWYRSATTQTVMVSVDRPAQVETLDWATGTALSWTRTASELSTHTRIRPFATLLGAWLPTRGLPVLHAAAAGDDDAAVLLVGPGRAGKSTTALACSDRGLRLVGDDFCAFDADTGRVHSLYRSVKLRHDSTAAFPQRALRCGDVDEHFTLLEGSTVLRSARVRAVIAVRPGPPGAAPTLRPVPADERLGYLASTRMLAYIAGAASIRPWMRAARTLATLPTFVLDLGWDLDAVVATIEAVRRGGPGADVS